MEELERLAGSVLVAGFGGSTLPTSLSRSLRDGALAGVIVFKRNLTGSLDALAELTRAVADTTVLAPHSCDPDHGTAQSEHERCASCHQRRTGNDPSPRTLN